MSAKREDDIRECPHCGVRVVWQNGVPATHRRRSYRPGGSINDPEKRSHTEIAIIFRDDPTCAELAAQGVKETVSMQGKPASKPGKRVA